jgi:hypothetical protein
VNVARAAVFRLDGPPPSGAGRACASGVLTDGWDGVRAAFGLAPCGRPGLVQRLTAAGRPVLATEDWADPAQVPVWRWQADPARALAQAEDTLAGLGRGVLLARAGEGEGWPGLANALGSDTLLLHLWPGASAVEWICLREGAAGGAVDLNISAWELASAVADLCGVVWLPPPDWIDACRTDAERGPTAAWRRG